MLVGLVIAVFIIGYFGYGLYELLSPDEKTIRLDRSFWNHNLVYVFAGGALLIGVYFGILGYRGGEQFDANLATEFVSIAVTIFIIDWLNGRRAEEQRKEEIIAQIESPVRDAAVEAIRLARKYNFLNEALKKVFLAGHELQGASLREANLKEADLSKANLQGADLRGANLQRAYLSSVNLQGAKLIGANLHEADLRGANLQGADLRGANLQLADLSRAKLQEAKLWMANLQLADLSRANIQGAGLSDAKLQGAKLWMANLQLADLSIANLQLADLRGANLQGADLGEANLQGAKLSRAKLQRVGYDKRTIWPEGFKPEKEGAILLYDSDEENE